MPSQAGTQQICWDFLIGLYLCCNSCCQDSQFILASQGLLPVILSSIQHSQQDNSTSSTVTVNKTTLHPVLWQSTRQLYIQCCDSQQGNSTSSAVTVNKTTLHPAWLNGQTQHVWVIIQLSKTIEQHIVRIMHVMKSLGCPAFCTAG